MFRQLSVRRSAILIMTIPGVLDCTELVGGRRAVVKGIKYGDSIAVLNLEM